MKKIILIIFLLISINNCGFKIAEKKTLRGYFISEINASGEGRINYKIKNLLKFGLGIFFIIISEVIMVHSGISIYNLNFYFIIPAIIFFIIYSYLYFNFKIFRRS